MVAPNIMMTLVGKSNHFIIVHCHELEAPVLFHRSHKASVLSLAALLCYREPEANSPWAYVHAPVMSWPFQMI